MENDLQIADHRRVQRRNACMQASIFHPLQTESLRCVVRNISHDGALIEFPRPKNLPTSFWLRLEGDTTLRLCTIAWRSDDLLGVEFSDQILERRRVERWAATHAEWSTLRAQKSNVNRSAPMPLPE